jgi:CheY-like chemotaxis protein
MNTDVSQACYLYVDDDMPSRRVMELILRRAMGVESLFMFDSSDEFMDRLKALPQRPDLILLDIHMHPHDGFELLGEIRKDPDHCHTRVVAVTASVMNEEISRLRTSGFDGAVGKPLNMSEFPTLIKRILEGETVWYVT